MRIETEIMPKVAEKEDNLRDYREEELDSIEKLETGKIKFSRSLKLK